MSEVAIFNQFENDPSVFRGKINNVLQFDATNVNTAAAFGADLGFEDYSIEYMIDRVILTQLRDHFAPSGTTIELIGFDHIYFKDFFVELQSGITPLFEVSSKLTLNYGGVFHGFGVGNFDSDASLEVIFGAAHFPYESTDFPTELIEIRDRELVLDQFTISDPQRFAFVSVVNDFNSDGFDDVFFAQSGDDFDPFPGAKDVLYFGSETGLIKQSDSPSLAYNTFTHSVAEGDVDADGDTDLLVGSLGGPNEISPYLLINNGNSFDLSQAGLPSVLINDFYFDGTAWVIRPDAVQGKESESFLSFNLTDLDGDGYPDLIAGPSDGIPPIDYRPAVFINNGDGTFSDTVQYIGQDGQSERGTLGISAADYDGDGKAEIFISEVNSKASSVSGVRLYDDYDSGFKHLYDLADFGVDFTQSSITPYGFENVDLNSDGFVDVIATHAGFASDNAFYNGSVQTSPLILLNDGTGFFTPLDLSIFELFSLNMVPIQKNDGSYSFLSFSREIQSDESNYLAEPQTTLVLLEASETLGTGPGYSDGAALGAPGFNESYYLRTYPEVIELIDQGIWENGLAHYLNLGRTLGYQPYAPGATVSGTANIDFVRYSSGSSELEASSFQGLVTVNNQGKLDRLLDIERVIASDIGIAFDVLHGHAGQTAKILGAVFGAESVANKEYAGIGLSLLDSGMTYEALAGLAIGVTGAASHTEICELLWVNVVGVPAEAADIAPFVQMLDNGDLSVTELVVLAADTALNAKNIDLVGLSATGLEYTPVG